MNKEFNAPDITKNKKAEVAMKRTNRSKEDPTIPPLWRDILNLLIKIAVVNIVLFGILTFIYGLHQNSGFDMTPIIKDGDLVMFYRLEKNYSKDDLAVLKYQGNCQVQRVVAKGGDTVDITDDGLVINGSLQQEPEITQKTYRFEFGIKLPVTLHKDQIFVLGDARNSATDSRVYGPVNTKDTLGKALMILKRRNL